MDGLELPGLTITTVEEAQGLLNLCERHGRIIYGTNAYFTWKYQTWTVASMWTPGEPSKHKEGILNIWVNRPYDPNEKLEIVGRFRDSAESLLEKFAQCGKQMGRAHNFNYQRKVSVHD